MCFLGFALGFDAWCLLAVGFYCGLVFVMICGRVWFDLVFCALAGLVAVFVFAD